MTSAPIPIVQHSKNHAGITCTFNITTIPEDMAYTMPVGCKALRYTFPTE